MWIEQLTSEYEVGRKELNVMRDNLSDSELDKMDKPKINSMIRDMTYSLNWLKIGREPGNLRGVDRRSNYQRRVLMDMDLFPSLEISPKKEDLTDDEKQAIINVLMVLSDRERQCYVLHKAYEMSMADIAIELDVSKSTVQTFLERANKKIAKKMLSYDCHTVAN